MSVSARVFQVFNTCLLILLAFIALYPLALGIVVSFTKEDFIVREGYKLIPGMLSLDAYKLIFSKGNMILNAYRNTVFITGVGTAGSVLISSLYAYVLSNKRLKYRNVFAFYMFIPMVFSGGLVPYYLVMSAIGMKNNMFAMIVPALLNAWHVYILRNFIGGLPDSLAESARIDGASELRIFAQIIMPLALPGVATIALFSAIGYWNEWFNAMLFITKIEMYPLQSILRIVMVSASNATKNLFLTATQMRLPEEGVKMATMVLTIGPIIFVYPFAQKYFIQGILIGAVKN